MESSIPHGPANVLRWLLIDLGVGTDPDDEDDPQDRVWPVHNDSEPDNPDNCITVYQTEGQQDGQDPHSGSLWHHIGWQVRIRSKTREIGTRKANDILTAICGTYWRTITITSTVGTLSEDYRVETVTPSGLPLYIGQEQGSNRHLHTINGFATIHPNP
jgi:hypothetical protein